MAQKFCTKCGAELKPGLKFCVKCGAEVKQDDSNKPAAPKKPQKKLLPYIPAMVIGILLTLVSIEVGVLAFINRYDGLIIVFSIVIGFAILNLISLIIFAAKNKRKTPTFIVAMIFNSLAMVVSVIFFSVGTSIYNDRQTNYHTLTIINGSHGVADVSCQDYNDYHYENNVIYKNNSYTVTLYTHSSISISVYNIDVYNPDAENYSDRYYEVRIRCSDNNSMEYGSRNMPNSDLTIWVSYHVPSSW